MNPYIEKFEQNYLAKINKSKRDEYEDLLHQIMINALIANIVLKKESLAISPFMAKVITVLL